MEKPLEFPITPKYTRNVELSHPQPLISAPQRGVSPRKESHV